MSPLAEKIVELSDWTRDRQDFEENIKKIEKFTQQITEEYEAKK